MCTGGVSICLILIAFMVLRFTIVFTLQEDYREIGIMKAIGLKDAGIKSVYLIKYLAIAVLYFKQSKAFFGACDHILYWNLADFITASCATYADRKAYYFLVQYVSLRRLSFNRCIC